MSNIARLNIIAEGQTEETFVRELLQEPLAKGRVYVSVRRVDTSRKRGRSYRGGMTTYAKAKRDIQRWLLEDQSAYLTTIFDLYKLPADFPGFDQAKAIHDPYQKVNQLEASLAADVGAPRFIPYIQLHEFEGRLFSDVQVIDAVLKTHHRRSQ